MSRDMNPTRGGPSKSRTLFWPDVDSNPITRRVYDPQFRLDNSKETASQKNAKKTFSTL